jgi:hypothetical protein
MSETLTKVVVNCETNVAEVIPLTAQEITDLATAKAAAETRQAAEEAEAAATAAAKASANTKLAALGLTEAEITALTK